MESHPLRTPPSPTSSPIYTPPRPHVFGWLLSVKLLAGGHLRPGVCAAFASSCHAGCLLLVALPLSPYCLGSPSLTSGALLYWYCAALLSSRHICFPIMLCHMLVLSSRLLVVVCLSCPWASWGGGRGLLTVSHLLPFARVRMLTTTVRTMLPWCWSRRSTPDCATMTRRLDIIRRNLLVQGYLACARTPHAAV